MESRYIKKIEKDARVFLLDIVCEYNLANLLDKMSTMYDDLFFFVREYYKSQSNWDKFYEVIDKLRLNQDVVSLLSTENKPMSKKVETLWIESGFPFNDNYGDFFIGKDSSFEDFLIYCNNRKIFVDKCLTIIKKAQIRKMSDVPKHYFIFKKKEIKQPKLF